MEATYPNVSLKNVFICTDQNCNLQNHNKPLVLVKIKSGDLNKAFCIVPVPHCMRSINVSYYQLLLLLLKYINLIKINNFLLAKVNVFQKTQRRCMKVCNFFTTKLMHSLALKGTACSFFPVSPKYHSLSQKVSKNITPIPTLTLSQKLLQEDKYLNK